MRVLVTGGAGFIGSHLVDALLREGLDVAVLDNFDAFYERGLKESNIREHAQHANYRFIEGDIRNIANAPAPLQQPFDAIVHLAAKAGVRPSIDDPLTYQ